MAKSKKPEILTLSVAELEALLEALRSLLPEELFKKVQGLLQTLQWLMGVIEQKTTSIRRLRRILFGPQTEKTDQLFGKAGSDKDSTETNPKDKGKKKRKGHGRKKADDYPGAKVVPVPHPGLCVGALCPLCLKAKVRALAPARLIRIVAQPMISALKYEIERFRCVLCGAVFTAPLPPEALPGKYDPSVGVMLALNRYGLGVPMYRTETWQQHFGVPLAASTQWELIAAASPAPKAVFETLKVEAAEAELLHT